ncbi:Rieske (2Fe-2S) protein [Anthocerotibacter panamensis]|uniref:Rieske (2Fe-2S) protein n=1 Tax=Anthocerotibacter panamensis TaxID=2857077 RepID=UPI001C40213F|nr:Rieske 2Fe-2S domain-containing protein [Anthocerotibacter panamensis]
MVGKFVEVCKVGDIPPGTSRLVMGPYEKPIALFNLAGELYAINAICPHMGGPLQSGTLVGDTVFCPWHQWSFRVTTGGADHPGGHRVATYHVRVEQDTVLVGWLKSPG